MADGTFSPAEPRKRAVGPGSNTGQKSPPTSGLTAPIIDFCVVVLDTEKAKKLFRKMPLSEVLRYVFGCGDAIVVGPLKEQQFNFYPRSATMVDALGEVCGKIGLGDEGQVCISLSGQGCQYVPSFKWVADVLDDLGARISHVDIAIDDLSGETFDINTFRNFYINGDFTMNGRPPKAQYISDEGSGDGCSFYVGQRGHKQLNIYEKGKQLGDPESAHTRCELRLYAKRIDLPNDVLRNPGRYFGAAYPMLAAYVVGEIERLGLKEQVATMTWQAMRKFLRTQGGTSLQLVLDVLGDDALRFIQQEIARPGRPGRFKSVGGDLHALLRSQLANPPTEKAA